MATRDERNWLKLTILMDKACLVLRQLFQKLWKMRFGHEWSGTEDDIKMMLAQTPVKNIGKLQYEAILTGDVHSWNLATLQVILTSTDFLNLTAKEARNINYLTNMRNKLVSSASKGLTDDELNAHWCAAVVILIEFGESEADLEMLKQDGAGGVEIRSKEEPIDDKSTLEARRLKEAGNVQFKQNNWADSVKTYTEAILLPGIPCADRAILYSNRSVSFMKLKELSLALEDAKKSVNLWPEWWRGHYRMGQVYTEMNNYEKAIPCFDQAHAREPHQEILEARSYAQMKQGQLDRNDAIDQRLKRQTLDEAISDYKRRTGSQVDPNTIKNMLHAEVDDPILQDWQDCQKGNNCEMGVDGFPLDYGLAAQYYKKSADRGSAEGLFSLALLTMEGRGVKRDMLLGIRMLKEVAGKPPLLVGGANFGVAEAEHALGLFYQDGVGVSKDELAAKEWYKRACEHGCLLAANNLGVLYGKDKDFAKAEQYLKMSTNAGHPKAMLNLAAHYTSQFDPDLALTWCQRARNAGMIGSIIDDIEMTCKNMIRTFGESGFKKMVFKMSENL